jgi:hypothetical protein
VPRGEVHENAMSLAMVAAAVESARTGRQVSLDEVLGAAHADAVAAAEGPERDVLRSWSSVRDALVRR